MGYNVKKALAYIQKDLSKNWPNITFDYEQVDKDEVKVTAEITLKGFDDDIMLIINVYTGGTAQFRAVFDKIEKNENSLALLNDFNASDPFFKIFIRDDGFLELLHFVTFYSEDIFKHYANEFLYRLLDLDENDSMVELGKLTVSDQ